MENLARTFLTEEEYLKQERNAPFKSITTRGKFLFLKEQGENIML